MGVAFLLFLPWANGAPNSTPLIAIVLILFVFTIAELFISPPGLSVTTKLAPERFHTQMVALYFLSVALGTSIAGWLAQFYDPDERGAVLHDPRHHRDRPRHRAAGVGEARARAHEGRALTCTTAVRKGAETQFPHPASSGGNAAILPSTALASP